MGSLDLSFPAGLGVRVEQSGFLASFDGGSLVKRGDAYYSADWSTAEHRVSVDIDAAFGSTTVRRTR
jgi:L-ascorbate metabolism protein UlaG (beta-lactamase superfamily)